MKVSSISGINCYVRDVAKTAEFYDAIGFRRGKEEPDRLTFYVNWFFVTFIAQDQEPDVELRAKAQPDRGSGIYLYVKVDDVDAFYEGVLSKGMKPVSEPQRASGRRAFVLRDPDGYRLVFFGR